MTKNNKVKGGEQNKMAMETAVRINEEEIAHKLALYMFLQKFYSGELIKVEKSIWEQLSALINEEVSYFSDEKMKKGITMISELNSNDLQELEFDFNLLFVGPACLEAAPYEAIYRSTERALMQAETMAVRKFYERAGLVLLNKNNVPDDHLSLELEFVCYLLEESVEDASQYDLYEAFLNLHLFKWVKSHCELVREKTNNTIIIGISYILQGLMEVESKEMNVSRR